MLLRGSSQGKYIAFAGLGLLLISCSDETAQLRVDLKTDWTSGVLFDEVRVELSEFDGNSTALLRDERSVLYWRRLV